jgi:hypothetical protein
MYVYTEYIGGCGRWLELQERGREREEGEYLYLSLSLSLSMCTLGRYDVCVSVRLCLSVAWLWLSFLSPSGLVSVLFLSIALWPRLCKFALRYARVTVGDDVTPIGIARLLGKTGEDKSNLPDLVGTP